MAIATNASAWNKRALGPAVAANNASAWRAVSDENGVNNVYVFSSSAAADVFLSKLHVMKARADAAWDVWFGKEGMPPYNVPHGPINDCCFV